jgi:hypothetical protein
MPSRRQRRRRQKNRRHEWEYVYVDDEGNEVEAPDDELALSQNGKRTNREQAQKRPASGMREVQPPSWRRVGKRGLIFAPLMFLVVTFLSGDLTIGQRIVNTAFLLAFFLPFSYAMDALMYRLYRKRTGIG